MMLIRSLTQDESQGLGVNKGLLTAATAWQSCPLSSTRLRPNNEQTTVPTLRCGSYHVVRPQEREMCDADVHHRPISWSPLGSQGGQSIKLISYHRYGSIPYVPYPTLPPGCHVDRPNFVRWVVRVEGSPRLELISSSGQRSIMPPHSFFIRGP